MNINTLTQAQFNTLVADYLIRRYDESGEQGPYWSEIAEGADGLNYDDFQDFYDDFSGYDFVPEDFEPYDSEDLTMDIQEKNRQLDAEFDARSSFYSKASVLYYRHTKQDGKTEPGYYEALESYGTKVAERFGDHVYINGLDWSPTTTRHIVEFCKQSGIPGTKTGRKYLIEAKKNGYIKDYLLN